MPGSSPLARGLLLEQPVGVGERRIIPARAGFTSGSGQPSWPGPDHPRSRGAFRPAGDAPPVGSGSSPLARGLPGRRGRRPGAGRIIPARAGFTGRLPPGRGGVGDHPRSRGVYRARHRRSARRWGSSPLARGLPIYRATAREERRIIPARAGFTSWADYVLTWEGDHPRSRGVYRRRHPVFLRGLWIIPARAGFTLKRERNSHAGIIPARAGFTRMRRRARGYDRWIIPARAGFT